MRIACHFAVVALIGVGIGAGLSGCVEGSQSGAAADQPRLSAPRPAPLPPRSTPTAQPAPIATATAIVTGAEWADRAVSAGDWSYRAEPNGSAALFGAVGKSAEFTVRCDQPSARVYLSRGGASAGSMTVRATSGLKTYVAAGDVKAAVGQGSVGQGSAGRAVAALSPNDAHLDAVIFSRGRFLVAANEAVDLIMPSWPEIARVVEDCRPANTALPQ